MAQVFQNVVELNLFSSRVRSVCDQMGMILKRTAVSTNIKDRLDYSCAVFDEQGGLIAQAAHIPVHLGSMTYAMQGLVGRFQWQPEDCLIVNNPYMGGTHLPDVTLISPLFVDGLLAAFVASRAHHASIGAEQPGSMPVSGSIDEEGLLLGPDFLLRKGRLQSAMIEQLGALVDKPALNLEAWASHSGLADFFAQISANRKGLETLGQLIVGLGPGRFQALVNQLNDYGTRLAQAVLGAIQDGCYSFEDWMDDDGLGGDPLAIKLDLTVKGAVLEFDFSGTAGPSPGNLNCPASVTAAAVLYVVRGLLPEHAPTCRGVFESIRLRIPPACLLDAQWPSAVAAGNVETSMRIVDVVLGALAQALPKRIPAAAQGTMNNLAMGVRTSGPEQNWDYYETIAGGLGAHAGGDGLSAVQAHMTNTLNTPVESLELHYPLRLIRYAVRRNSGGRGCYRGGDGVIREFEFTAPASISLLTERRGRRPWGLAGGQPGQPGENRLNGELLPGKTNRRVRSGDRLTIMTPGGGGFGAPA